MKKGMITVYDALHKKCYVLEFFTILSNSIKLYLLNTYCLQTRPNFVNMNIVVVLLDQDIFGAKMKKLRLDVCKSFFGKKKSVFQGKCLTIEDMTHTFTIIKSAQPFRL